MNTLKYIILSAVILLVCLAPIALSVQPESEIIEDLTELEQKIAEYADTQQGTGPTRAELRAELALIQEEVDEVRQLLTICESKLEED